MTHPFEGNVPEEPPQARPMPCPECGSTRGYVRMGPFRVHCLGCNALLKNEEVDMQLPNEEQ
jgi:hypothetical protein